MSYCTPCPPCDSEFPLLCEPLETTANGKRLVVEDSAACQKTIQSPVAQQVLKTDGAGNLTWTNGASGTVLRKDSTGLVEFATLNSVLQSGPVDLGSQPLTTTGTATTGAITSSGNITSGNTVTCKLLNVENTSGTAAIEVGGTTNAYIDLKNPSSDDFDVRLGTIGGTSATLETGNNQPLAIYAGSGNVNIQPFGNGRVGIGNSNPQSLLHLTGTAGQPNIVTLLNTANPVGEQGMRVTFDDNPARLTVQRASDSGAFEANLVSIMQDTGRVGINTISPAKTLHVNGTVRLQGLPTYANNAAAISGGLVADDVYKTATGELRIVV